MPGSDKLQTYKNINEDNIETSESSDFSSDENDHTQKFNQHKYNKLLQKLFPSNHTRQKVIDDDDKSNVEKKKKDKKSDKKKDKESEKKKKDKKSGKKKKDKENEKKKKRSVSQDKPKKKSKNKKKVKESESESDSNSVSDSIDDSGSEYDSDSSEKQSEYNIILSLAPQNNKKLLNSFKRPTASYPVIGYDGDFEDYDEEYFDDDDEYFEDEDEEYIDDEDEYFDEEEDEEFDKEDYELEEEEEEEDENKEKPSSSDSDNDTKKNKRTSRSNKIVTNKEIINKFDSIVKNLSPEEQENELVKNMKRFIKEENKKTEEKEKKRTKKERMKNSNKFRKLQRDNNISNDIRYFQENLTVEEQKIALKQMEEIRKFSHIEKPYRLALLETDIPASYKSFAMKKINSLRYMEPGEGEYYKVKNWVDAFMQIPFGKYRELPITIDDGIEKCHSFLENAKKTLDAAVYGLNDAKMQILQMVGQWIANPQSVGTAIAIKGPMGTGKTTLVKEGISKVLGRDFAFIALWWSN